MWDFNQLEGSFTSKLGYFVLLDLVEMTCWWWKELWEVVALLKSMLFLWLVLNQKVSTYECLQRRGKSGPSMCPLCRIHEETIEHLFFLLEISTSVEGGGASLIGGEFME